MTTDTVTADLATPRQVAFIKSLLKERGLEPEVNPALTKKAASALIKTLLATPKTVKVTVAASSAADVPASEKQIAFLRTLLVERESGVTDPDAFFASVGDLLTKNKASKLISDLLKAPKIVKAKPVAPVAAYGPPAEVDPYLADAKKGDVHVLDGEYIRLHQRQNSGKLYAARAKIIAHAVWGTNDDGTAKLLKAGRVQWVTAYKLIYELSEATKATAEESAAFGKMLGRCVYCSLQIDTPESVSVGYGKVCAGNKGLPWGPTALRVL